jgi:hypothetical protein
MKIWRDNQEAVALCSYGMKHFFNFISNGQLVSFSVIHPFC